MSIYTRRRVLSLVSALFPLSICAQTPEPRPAATARYSAGLRNLKVPYYDLPPIEANVWFPTTAPEVTQSFGPFAPRVALRAALAQPDAQLHPGGRFPLVLISHGTGANSLAHHTLAEALARAGFVAVSFTHPGDNHLDRSLVTDRRYFFERPRQIRHVLDAVLRHEDWAGVLDDQRIGALGHSAGGYSVAALVGAEPDLERLRAHCQQATDDPSCALQDPRRFVQSPRQSPLALPETVTASGSLLDNRIRAALLMAPFAAGIRGGSLAQSSATIRVLGAEHDEVLPHRYHFDYISAELAGAAHFAGAERAMGAGHMSFIVPFVPQWRSRMGEVAFDPPGFDRVAFHERLSADVVAYFQQALALKSPRPHSG